jgi:glycosyltransferase involved in cell wall biosynthesis
MKILQLIPSLNKGGAERLAASICNELSCRAELDVLLVTLHPGNSFQFLSNKFQHEVIGSYYIPSISGKPKYDLTEWERILNKFKPDVIHTHLFEGEIVSRSSTFSDAVYFSHGHNCMPQFQNFSFRTLCDKKALITFYEKQYLLKRYVATGGTNFIAISKNTEEYYKHVLPSALSKQVHLLHNAIDYNRFNKSAEKQQDKIRLVSVGTLDKNKNQQFLIRVMKILQQENIDAELVLVGDGSEMQNLKQLTVQLNVQDKVKFTGNVDLVENYLNAANIYVHSAISEAFGLAILEGMAAGNPAIALDGNGNRDLIKDGYNGYIMEGNEKLFAQKIVQVFADKKFYETLSINARKFASEYDLPAYCDKLLQLYSQAIKRKMSQR